MDCSFLLKDVVGRGKDEEGVKYLFDLAWSVVVKCHKDTYGMGAYGGRKGVWGGYEDDNETTIHW